jgi:hypothetical protein
MEDTIDSPWRKATYSGNGGGNCVEAATSASRVLVRDTADRDGGMLPVPADAWRELITGLKSALADRDRAPRIQAGIRGV